MEVGEIDALIIMYGCMIIHKIIITYRMEKKL